MPGYTWILDTGKETVFGHRIAMANAADLYLDSNEALTGLRNIAFYNLQGSTGARDLDGAHFRHDEFLHSGDETLD
jgi:hypothetical protein